MNDDVKSLMYCLHYLWNSLTVSAMSLEHMCSTFVGIYEKFDKFLVFHDTHALLKMKLKNWEFPKTSFSTTGKDKILIFKFIKVFVVCSLIRRYFEDTKFDLIRSPSLFKSFKTKYRESRTL